MVYPLLVLALTDSPAKAGFVAFVRYLPMALLSLPAGLAVDRFPRKRLMIAADSIRALAVAGLVVAIATDSLEYRQIVATAAIEGSAWALFHPAAAAALRSVVPQDQLADAAGVAPGSIGDGGARRSPARRPPVRDREGGAVRRRRVQLPRVVPQPRADAHAFPGDPPARPDDTPRPTRRRRPLPLEQRLPPRLRVPLRTRAT